MTPDEAAVERVAKTLSHGRGCDHDAPCEFCELPLQLSNDSAGCMQLARAALAAAPASGKFAGWSDKELSVALAMTLDSNDFTPEYRSTAVALYEEAEAERVSRRAQGAGA